MVAASIRLGGAPSVHDMVEALEAFRPDTAGLKLPTSPQRFVQVWRDADRPQPRRDVEEDGGMRVHVGRIRTCHILGVKMIILGHNTERGAAGGSVLNAELALAKGYL
jgi:aspartate-semialdehyde dehydrogenase